MFHSFMENLSLGLGLSKHDILEAGSIKIICQPENMDVLWNFEIKLREAKFIPGLWSVTVREPYQINDQET